jgi:hypothetical protein
VTTLPVTVLKTCNLISYFSDNRHIFFVGLEDKASACEMLVCYARELKEGFADYAEEVVKLMVPMLKFYFHDGVRTAAAESLPYLLDCAKIKGWPSNSNIITYTYIQIY